MGRYPLHACHTAVSAVVISQLALSACASASKFSLLPVESGKDTSLSCEGFENELLRANALRDAILEEQGDFLATGVTDGAISVVTADPLGAAISAAMGSSRHRKYQEAASAAEARMIHVLLLREARQCPAGPSGDSTRTERQILSELQVLDRRLSTEDLSELTYRAERRELLDSLR
jgi:hypothetical protein